MDVVWVQTLGADYECSVGADYWCRQLVQTMKVVWVQTIGADYEM